MPSSAVNWKDCIRQSNNRPKLAEELLNMFSLELPDFQQKIQSAWRHHDLPTLKAQIHKLHGACCYCGANTLKQQLHTLENRIDTLDMPTLSQYIQSLDSEIERVKIALSTQDYK